MSNFSEKDILAALSHVEDPDLKKDLVSAGMIKDIESTDAKISFTLELTTPACPMKDMLHNACINAIKHFVNKDVEVDINITSRPTAQSQATGNLLNVKNIIAVASGKGGVGKSTVSAALALYLAQQGADVGLLDADIYGPSLTTQFPNLGGIKNVESTKTGKMQMEPPVVDKVKMMSIGMMVKKDEAVVWRGPMISSALRQMIVDVNWGNLDYLIIDLPPGTGDIQMSITSIIPLTGAVIVTTPQSLSVSDVRRAIAMFKHKNINKNVLGLVENMSYFVPPDMPEKRYEIFGKGGADLLAKEFDLPVLGKLPIDIEVGNNPYSLLINSTPSGKVFKEIADKIIRTAATANFKQQQNE